MHDSTSEEDRRVLQEMVGRSGSPAFIRRAKLVETTWAQLLSTCEKARRERLTFVGLRLGQLHALAGGWDVVRGWLPGADDLERLQRLHEELQPCLRLPLEATTSRRAHRTAGRELLESMQLFNDRWQLWLAKVDLAPVNTARENYNRYYLFEKECAVGNVRVARLGFTKLTPATLEDVDRLFPLLVLPTFNWWQSAT